MRTSRNEKEILERKERRQRAIKKHNPAKTFAGESPRLKKKKVKAAGSVAKKIGIFLGLIYLVATGIFLFELKKLNILPDKFYLAGMVCLFLLWLFPFLIQLFARKKAVLSKLFCVFMSGVLLFGAFYIHKANSTVKNITIKPGKANRMVVAVLAENKAENIRDAKNYDFGVQYVLKGGEIREAVGKIEKEVGNSIKTKEYDTLGKQAMALKNGEVEAIIYNESHRGVIKDYFPNMDSQLKIIYSYELKNEQDELGKVDLNQKPFVMYISGIDVYGGIETKSRSDVNIIAVINPASHQVLLVATPRDYYVELPGISGGQRDKLTHAGIYGVDASISTLESIYKTDIEFYTRVNFTSLIQIIDALGGVDVVSEEAFTTSEDSEYVMDVVKGTNHFNGVQALAFARERQNVAGGDFQRGRNQEAVITGMIKKAISPAILVGAGDILKSISGNVDTNLSQEQIQSLIKKQLDDGKEWEVISLMADGIPDMAVCYSSGGQALSVVIPYEESVEMIREAIRAAKEGKPLDQIINRQLNKTPVTSGGGQWDGEGINSYEEEIYYNPYADTEVNDYQEPIYQQELPSQSQSYGDQGPAVNNEQPQNAFSFPGEGETGGEPIRSQE